MVFRVRKIVLNALAFLTSAILEQTAGSEINFGAFQQGGISAGSNITISNADFMLVVRDVEGGLTLKYKGLSIRSPYKGSESLIYASALAGVFFILDRLYKSVQLSVGDLSIQKM